MAQYQYDGSMAAYFILTFLSLVLAPLTYSFLPGAPQKKQRGDECQCDECVKHREEVRRREKRSIFRPKITKKALITLLGWILFAATAYKVSITPVQNTIYDPFAILGMKRSSTEAEIKKHYKRLSLKFHPDKVKLGPNDTMDSIQEHFVKLTKAYKALTDETIRKNVLDFNDPDGRQQFSTGIAIPPWIVAAQNNIWVLGMYGLLFGVGLPALVGRWWFGSRRYTKDGVQTRTAELFFKAIDEDMSEQDIVLSLGKALALEKPASKGGKAADNELLALKSQVVAKLGNEWKAKTQLADLGAARALILLYAHLLRIEVNNAALRNEQRFLLLHTPNLLASLLNIAISHSWLLPTVRIMHLHSNLAQAILPGSASVIQFPGIKDSTEDLPEALDALIEKLEENGDPRMYAVKKVAEKWGRLEVVEAAYKVIGERLVTSGAIVQLVIKLRLQPPAAPKLATHDIDAEKEKRDNKFNDEKDEAFLVSKKDFEDLPAGESILDACHAPLWPSNRRPRWWIVLGDEKSNRVVVPPMQISDLPFSDPRKRRNFRTFRLQFQAPSGVGLYTWRIRFISDTFIGEDVAKDLTLKVEALSQLTAEEQHKEDQISDPEEDTLAGQMAAMRGGPVKRNQYDSDESSTDDETEESDSSDSD